LRNSKKKKSGRSKVNISKFAKGESYENIIEKLIHKKFQLLKHIFVIFSRKFQDFSGQLLSKILAL
jgi:hypothetical protein